MQQLSRPRAARLAAALATGALSLSLASCGTGGDGTGGAGDDDTLSVVTRWSSGNTAAAAQKRAFAAFTKKTGIKIKATDGLENVDDQVENAVAAGKSPDLVIVNLYDKTLGWKDAGVTVPVDKYVKEWGLEDRIKPAALDEWRVGSTHGGEAQGLPYSGFSWPVWYNTDLLKKAGVREIPRTTDELLAAAEKLRAKGIGPLAAGGNDWTGQKLFYQFAQSFTEPAAMRKVMKEGGYCATPSVMKGIELFTKLRDGGVFVDDAAGLTADSMYASYFAGKTAMMSAGSWAYTEAAASRTGVEKHTELGGLPLPEGAVFDKPTAFQGFTGVGFMITKHGAGSGRIDKVRKLVTSFYAHDTIGGFVKDASILPPTTGDFSASATDPLLKKSLDLDAKVDYATVPDVFIGSASDRIVKVLTAAYGSSSPREICSGLDTATKG
ncbi:MULTISPECIES: ABC transporter substrate-binding protein [Streptomyces]|uniref:Extracellular solute-binding protein n=1 Tax=Streptomyces evansiae TaxID=3075535 RepID=A0ABD5E807_9ACTN|nr:MULTISPECIES: extracellular solute-binding protein [unclassified Streptomyces]ASY32074.1 ABC transporter substrate-binding protein [Streptomyces sp. CLI2509]MDT0416732.1 extracellular solute-binding protein [Streptomyces sp. DSM 41982]MYX19945.1 extracellular solute-binding protein [Streptomyces sp. SID8380]SCD44412.1 multiple sugar transport system substrate-binding protein [Streptomyces sp. SolWspMP-sol7th]